MKISIAILTWNRLNILIETIDTVLNQSYLDKEIIVVDNGSTDETASYINKHYPQVKVIRLENNIGVSGRNYGIKAAEGDIIVTIDDDVCFVSNHQLEDIYHYFNEHADVDVIVFRVLNEEGHVYEVNWYHPKDIEKHQNEYFSTDYLPEGASAFRSEVFKRVGYYPDSFFIGHEGLDLAYRILDHDMRIEYNPNIKVIHKHSPVGRKSWRFVYYNTRNHIWFIVRNLPIRSLVFSLLYRLALYFVISIINQNIKWYFKGVFDGFYGIKTQLSYRKPVRRSTLKKITQIRKDVSVLKKIKTFLIKMRQRK